jgi:hypothetical protein
MSTNRILAVLAFIGILLVLVGNFLLTGQPWIRTYWVVYDIYSAVMLLVMGWRLYQAN